MYYCLRTTRAHIRTPKNMTYFHFILDPFKNFSHRKQSKVKQSQIRLNKLLVFQVKHIPRYWFCSIYACAMFYLGGIRALSSAQRAPLRLTSFFFFFFFLTIPLPVRPWKGFRDKSADLSCIPRPSYQHNCL